MLCFEDFTAGWAAQSSAVTVSADEIIAFANQWDPQAFHLDDQASKEAGFSGLIASGVHSWAITQRLAVDSFLNGTRCLGSPGYDSIKFLSPLRPDTHVVARFRVMQSVPSASRKDRGRVLVAYSLVDLANERPVLEATVWIIVAMKGSRPV